MTKKRRILHNRYALIVAGGSGTRMESNIPKQFLNLNGIPLLMHTLSVFHSLEPNPQIYLVLPATEHNRWTDLCNKHTFQIPHTIISGGESRFHSVKNGLWAIDNDGLIAIHDGVRPLVSPSLIEKCYRMAEEKGNAIPAIKPYESIRYGKKERSSKENRELYWLVQTPQVFFLNSIKSNYLSNWRPEFTDDASVAEAHGQRIQIIEGERDNIKITSPIDIAIASAILEYRSKI